MSGNVTVTNLNPVRYFITDPVTGECYEVDKLTSTISPMRLMEQSEIAISLAVEAERARIREWAETHQTMAPVEFEDLKGYRLCLDDLLDFLQENKMEREALDQNDEQSYEKELRRQLVAYAVLAERARIREWAEKHQTMAPVQFEDIKGYYACLDDLLEFLKEPE